MSVYGYEQPAPRDNLKWVYVDLDGTLAKGIWTPGNPTSEIGAPIERNVAKLNDLDNHGYKINIHTSRAWTDYEAIEYWLQFWSIPWHQIQCGKPLGVLYVDDRGRHESAISWLPEDDPRDPRESDLQMSLNGEINELKHQVSKAKDALLNLAKLTERQDELIQELRKELGL